MARRILILGTTGLDKHEACLRISAQGARLGNRVSVNSFEKDVLARPGATYIKSLASYLSKDVVDQARVWRAAWPEFVTAIRQNDSADFALISLHGTLVRHFCGVRLGLDVARVCEDLRPDLIVSLQDDVYNMWWRTETRAKGDWHTGRPTLEQLIMARRAEGMVGDALAARMSIEHGQSVRHITISVNHPVHALCNIIFHDASCVYLSFPISAPRRLYQQRSDSSLIDHINTFHSKANDAQRANSKVAFISPLGIDELPFVAATRATAEGQAVQFDHNSRWNLSALWQGAELLASQPEASELPWDQADHVRGAIETDVGWRDNRLVLQSAFLAVFSPAMPAVDGLSSKLARGVREELERAMGSSIRSVVLQPPELDPSRRWAEYHGDVGSMGMGPGHEYIRSVASLDELFSMF